MSSSGIIPPKLREKLIKIKQEILSGKISLLKLELDPLFQEIIDSVNTNNIFHYSPLYKETNDILCQKFEELKKLLIRMDNEQKYMEFLKKTPTDPVITALFDGCWRKTFHIESLSFDFLRDSQQKLLAAHKEPIKIKELSRVANKEQFILEIPKQKFTEKMNHYFTSISDKLPCGLDDIFEMETDQLVIYEKFIYLLHLLQLGRIKYQKETNTLYL